MGKKKQPKNTALATLMRHFPEHDFADLTTFRRNFPTTGRADLQAALQGLLAQAKLFGLCRQWQHEALKFSDFLDQQHSPVLIGPVQYDEVDVGEREPLRCLHQGLWLLHYEGQPFGLLVAQAPEQFNRTGTALELISPPSAVAQVAAAQLLENLENRVAEARTYRGKVLSLEGSDHYGGADNTVRVHRLPAVSREEVILPEKTLQLLERNVHDFIAQRQQLRRLGMAIKKGLLFHGPPGTGKTHTIRYLASQLPDHTTFLISAEQVGKLPQYMQFARFLQPAIVVLEDVDLIARRREISGVCQEVVLNQLLNEMDGLREDAEILFVLTTNRPEQLESALASRPGRIDQAIEFPLPDEDGRAKLLKLYSGGLKLNARLVKDAVRRTQGASAAFIRELMRRAAQHLLRDGGTDELQSEHLRTALEEMVFAGGALNLKLLGASQDINLN